MFNVYVDSEERSFNQTLREQQDEAYRQSLRADQEKVLCPRVFICARVCGSLFYIVVCFLS